MPLKLFAAGSLIHAALNSTAELKDLSAGLRGSISVFSHEEIRENKLILCVQQCSKFALKRLQFFPEVIPLDSRQEERDCGGRNKGKIEGEKGISVGEVEGEEKGEEIIGTERGKYASWA